MRRVSLPGPRVKTFLMGGLAGAPSGPAVTYELGTYFRSPFIDPTAYLLRLGS
jgi:hypothetical protein